MIILPVVLLGLSGIGGAGGIALSAKGIVDSLEASATNRYVQEENERNMLRFGACSKQLDEALQRLGKQRMVIAKNFNVFVNAFEKIHNRPEFSTGEDAVFPTFDFDEIKNVSVVADMCLGVASGAVAGSALGAAAASGTTVAVMALGKASTGAKIAGLSGAAKTNAALAALGGGAKAAGGGGMALGGLVLNAATLGVGVLVEGLALAYVSSIARKEADKAKETLKNNESILMQAIDMQFEVTEATNKMKNVSVELCNTKYKQLVFKLKELVEKKNDWNDYTEEERKLVDNNILIVQILHYLNNIPLYKVTKLNAKGEIEEIEPNSEEVATAIIKAKQKSKEVLANG